MILDIEAIVEWLDPDWRDHFIDLDQAAEHYQHYAPSEWADAVKEIGL